MAARKFDEADANIKALLETDPNNGSANLLSAKLMAQEGHIPDAEAHYHRAIYGAWTQNAPAHQLAVRLELATLQASRGEKEELLAELLAIESEAQGKTTILKQIADLYRLAGSPARCGRDHPSLRLRKTSRQFFWRLALARIRLTSDPTIWRASVLFYIPDKTFGGSAGES
jgi:hypothetical protein